MTFSQDLTDRSTIQAEALQLSEMVGKRARRYGFAGKKVSLTIRYPDFETVSKQTTLHDYTNHTHEIYQNVLAILDSIRLRDDIRLLGRVGGGREDT